MSHGGAFSTIPATERVQAAHLEDQFRSEVFRCEELLKRERFLSTIAGYDSTADYLRPLMRDKQLRSLGCLGNVTQSFGEDMIRLGGFAEVGVQPLSNDDTSTSLCLLDFSTVACASTTGSIWVYNFIEGAVVSEMRASPGEEQLSRSATGSHAAVVRKLCCASENHALLAGGDDNGVVELWNLAGPERLSEARLHEGPVTGLAWPEVERSKLMVTSVDTYITVFDMEQHTVVERGMPKSLSCGSGVPNTALALGQQDKLVLVGGLDGKLRVWTRGDRPLERLCTLPCDNAAPTQCCVAADGWRVAVSTQPAGRAHCKDDPGTGGLLLFDIRKLNNADTATCSALMASAAAPSLGPGFASGIVDMALVEAAGETLAVCLAGNCAKIFDLAGPIDGSGLLEERFEMEVAAPEIDSARPCAIASLDHTVVTATASPSVDFWRWIDSEEPRGHEDYTKEFDSLAPLALCARAVPRPGQQAPASALSAVQAALERDRLRSLR